MKQIVIFPVKIPTKSLILA